MSDRPRPQLYETIRRMGIISWSMVGALVFVGMVVWLLSKVSNIIPGVVLAAAIIYLLNPVVSWLHRLRVPRLLGSLLAYFALAGVVALAVWLAIPPISDQARELGDDFPVIYDGLATDAEGWVGNVGIDIEVPRYDELQDYFGNATDEGGFLSLERIGDVTLTVLEFVLILILAPVIAFYLLYDLPKLRDQVVLLVPGQNRGEFTYVTRQLGRAVGGFLRGQLLVALIVGLLTSFGFWVIDLQFWLLIGMIAGFLNIIPFVGPWVGGTLGVLVALATADATTALWAAIVAAAVQQVDNHFISPTVLRFTVRLHPATIIIALLIGGTVGGLLGVLLAVPVVASIKIVVGHFWRTRILDQSWEEASEALIEEHPTGETPIVRRLRGEPEGPDEPREPPPQAAAGGEE